MYSTSMISKKYMNDGPGVQVANLWDYIFNTTHKIYTLFFSMFVFNKLATRLAEGTFIFRTEEKYADLDNPLSSRATLFL